MEKYYTVEEVADILKVNKFTVYRWVNEKRLKSLKFGTSVRISQKDLDQFLDNAKRE